MLQKRRLAIAGFTAVFAASSANADVTITASTTGKVSVMNVSGVGTSKIQGNRMRTDQTVGGRQQALVVDIDGRRFLDINDKKKSVSITPLDAIQENLDKIGAGTMSATLAKTSETKTVAGFGCTVHDIRVTYPFDVTGNNDAAMSVTMTLSGKACLSTDAPGYTDYRAFYRASAASGFIFGDPRMAKSPTGAAQAKAYAEFTRKMAEAGMALETHITVSATGENPMSQAMAKLAASDIRTIVTSIDTGALDAALFDVPAGYKSKVQK
jgi:hypothetical protein